MGRPNGKKESLKNSLLLTSSDTCVYNKRCSKNHIAWWKFHCCHQSYWLYQLPKLKSMVGNIFQLNVSLDEVVGCMGLLLAFYSSEMHRNVIRLIKNVTQCIFKWSGRRMGLLLTSTLFNRRVPSPWADVCSTVQQSLVEKLKLILFCTFREAIVQKITEFYEIIS